MYIKEFSSYETPLLAQNISSRMAERLTQNIYNHFGGMKVYFIAMDQRDTTITGELKLRSKTNKTNIEAIKNFINGFIAGINALS